MLQPSDERKRIVKMMRGQLEQYDREMGRGKLLENVDEMHVEAGALVIGRDVSSNCKENLAIVVV